MTNKLLFLIFIISFASSTVFTQKQAVYTCPTNPVVNDTFFENAIQKTISNDKSIDFLTDDNPCSDSKSSKSIFNATINKNYFNLATNHSFSYIKFGENFISIEQFVFKTEKQANLISKILKNRDSNMLQYEGFAFYDYFQVQNRLIFYIASRQIYRDHLPFFQNFKENFLLEYKK